MQKTEKDAIVRLFAFMGALAIGGILFAVADGSHWTPPPPFEALGSGLTAVFTVLVTVAGLVFVYLLPSIVAFGRHKHNAVAITALNVLLGWTLLGWVAAFVWSLTTDKPQTASAG